jgi:hypothetical protein
VIVNRRLYRLAHAIVGHRWESRRDWTVLVCHCGAYKTKYRPTVGWPE